MEKLLINGCDKEYMKMAMLKHEETFKQQVHELHRLYKIQKGLMEDHINENSIHDHLETQLDLTLGPTSFYPEKKTNLDRVPSFSSSNSTSIGSSKSKREIREETRNGKKWDHMFSDKGFQRSGNISFDDQDGNLNRQKKDAGMPSWLYGAMSLKMS